VNYFYDADAESSSLRDFFNSIMILVIFLASELWDNHYGHAWLLEP